MNEVAREMQLALWGSWATFVLVLIAEGARVAALVLGVAAWIVLCALTVIDARRDAQYVELVTRRLDG